MAGAAFPRSCFVAETPRNCGESVELHSRTPRKLQHKRPPSRLSPHFSYEQRVLLVGLRSPDRANSRPNPTENPCGDAREARQDPRTPSVAVKHCLQLPFPSAVPPPPSASLTDSPGRKQRPPPSCDSTRMPALQQLTDRTAICAPPSAVREPTVVDSQPSGSGLASQAPSPQRGLMNSKRSVSLCHPGVGVIAIRCTRPIALSRRGSTVSDAVRRRLPRESNHRRERSGLRGQSNEKPLGHNVAMLRTLSTRIEGSILLGIWWDLDTPQSACTTGHLCRSKSAAKSIRSAAAIAH
jgi:hypothetical protein